MDQLVFEEFKGTGNMELVLNRKLSDRRIFPAIDIEKSAPVRRRLVGLRRLKLIHVLRPRARMHFAEAAELLITRLDDVARESSSSASRSIRRHEPGVDDRARWGSASPSARIQAVRGVSFEVAAGELVGFLGPNGAGKSTTMKMLTGSLLPDAGRATVAEMPLDGRSAGRAPPWATCRSTRRSTGRCA